MPTNDAPPIFSNYREAMHAFVYERLNAKLEKLKADEDGKRTELIAEHQPSAWLEDAARRVQQIQAVTHSLKPIHPDARGTNLYVEPRTLPPLDELGSHALGERFVGDVVGNAAALDVYKLLKLEVNGRSLLTALLAQDADALAALHADPAQAQALRDSFVSLTQPRAEGPSSHTLAKQLYWLTGTDACDDAHYTLLAPLYATSLAHAVHAQVQEDRFGEANKAARQARRERKMHDGVFHDYPGLAVQNMGGTKPQNISQLNSERRGMNYLLSSLPPQWQASAVRLPVHATSVFGRNLSIAMQSDVRVDTRGALESLQMGFIPVVSQTTYKKPDEPDFDIDFLTSMGRKGDVPVHIPALNVTLQPLRFMELSMEAPMRASLLTRAGSIAVNVPRPERYALHKLIVSQMRPLEMRVKANKDIAQAAHLLDYLLSEDEDLVAEAWRDVQGRGKSWSTKLNAGFKAMQRAFAEQDFANRLKGMQ